MFERYTEKARRVVFFARYEASQYGSPNIETEHLLLGLLREDHAVRRRLLGSAPGRDSIREEIEQYITRGERVSTSVEMPLSRQSKQVLMYASEEATRLGHRFISTEHLFLGLARVEQGLAATILAAHGMTIEKVRVMITHFTVEGSSVPPAVLRSAAAGPSRVLEALLNALRSGVKKDSLECLASQAQFIDPHGRRWLRKEILEENLEELFGRFAARNARYTLEDPVEQTVLLCVANLLWENLPTQEKEKDVLRMTVTLARSDDGADWLIYAIQVTPVKLNWTGKGA